MPHHVISAKCDGAWLSFGEVAAPGSRQVK